MSSKDGSSSRDSKKLPKKLVSVSELSSAQKPVKSTGARRSTGPRQSSFSAPQDEVGLSQEAVLVVPFVCEDRNDVPFFEVCCGSSTGKWYMSKCRNKEGKMYPVGKQECILCYENEKWYTPNQFQDIGGRAATRNWKRSIMHKRHAVMKYLDWIAQSASSQPVSSEVVEQAIGTVGDDSVAGGEAISTITDRIIAITARGANESGINMTGSGIDETFLLEAITAAVAKAIQPLQRMLQDKVNALELELEKVRKEVVFIKSEAAKPAL